MNLQPEAKIHNTESEVLQVDKLMESHTAEEEVHIGSHNQGRILVTFQSIVSTRSLAIHNRKHETLNCNPSHKSPKTSLSSPLAPRFQNPWPQALKPTL